MWCCSCLLANNWNLGKSKSRLVWRGICRHLEDLHIAQLPQEPIASARRPFSFWMNWQWMLRVAGNQATSHVTGWTRPTQKPTTPTNSDKIRFTSDPLPLLFCPLIDDCFYLARCTAISTLSIQLCFNCASPLRLRNALVAFRPRG